MDQELTGSGPLTRGRQLYRLLDRVAMLLPYAAFAGFVTVDLIVGSDAPAHPGIVSAGFAVQELIGLGLSLRVATSPRLDPAHRRQWWFLAMYFVLLGVSSAALAAATALGSDDAARSVLSPMMVTALTTRLLVTLALFAGLMSFQMKLGTGRARLRFAMDSFTIVGGALMVGWWFLLGPALTLPSSMSDPLAFVTPMYLLTDLLLVFGVSNVLLRVPVTGARRPMKLVMSGALAYLVADLYLAYTTIYRPDLGSSVSMDIAHWAAILLIAAAASEQCRETAVDRIKRETAPAGRPVNWLPYAALFLAYVLLIAVVSQDAAYPWWGLVAGGAVMTVGVVVREIIALRERRDRVMIDSLTRLPNRMRLRETLAMAARRSRETKRAMAILIIDLDGFKLINDTHGHEVGDAILQAFADVLRGCMRQSDTPGRLGGDEFAVILEDLNEAEDAIMVAQRILDTAAQPVVVGDEPIRIRASIGIALADMSTEGRRLLDDPLELLRCADQAMYVAKRRRTHSWYVHAEETGADPDVEALRSDLDQAVARGQMRVVYQPIITLGTGMPNAVEALVRWEHPQRGLLAPDAFMFLAEETGIIMEIDTWVLEQACRQVLDWRTRFPGGPPLQLSSNISAVHLRQDALASQVMRILERTGFDPNSLILEITETAAFEDDLATRQLEILRASGVRIALDDFGTGYSSLRQLIRLPIDILKLDRCFVAELNGGPEEAAVAEAVLRLGQAFRLETIAEGIEEPAQAAELALLGYDNGQGYHFARPLTPQAMSEFLERVTSGQGRLEIPTQVTAPRTATAL